MIHWRFYHEYMRFTKNNSSRLSRPRGLHYFSGRLQLPVSLLPQQRSAGRLRRASLLRAGRTGLSEKTFQCFGRSLYYRRGTDPASRIGGFYQKIRSLGLAVKLDTNGFRPEVLKRLCEQSLIDYAAMDIKAGRANYGRACGVPGISLAPIEESVSFLLSGAVPFEFRTTVVRELHSEEDFIDIAQWINGCSSYFLQSYQDSENVLTPGFSACSKEELLHYLDIVRPCAKTVKLRGVD